MARVTPGTTVIALQSMDADTAYIYGEGEYLGDKVPDAPWLPVDFHNPCIQLKNGQYVWGFECWWGEAESVRRRIGDRDLVEVPIIEPVLPKR